MLHDEIKSLIEEIALDLDRGYKLWPSFERRIEIARAEWSILKRNTRCKTKHDEIRLAKRELLNRVRQALGLDELEVKTSASDPARSFGRIKRIREKSAKNKPDELVQYGCEDDERTRHKKTAWKLKNPVSLSHQSVVRDADGRVVPYGWRRRWWDDEDSTSNPSAHDE